MVVVSAALVQLEFAGNELGKCIFRPVFDWHRLSAVLDCTMKQNTHRAIR